MNSNRIAYLTKKFPRLSETFVLNELLSLEEGGAELVIFSRRTPDDEPAHPQLARLSATVEVLPQRSELDPWEELFLFDDDSAELVERVGGVVRAAKRWRSERMPRLIAEALWVRRRCNELDIDHLHVHFATEAAIVACLARRLGGPSYSITAHAKDIYRHTVDTEMLSRVVAESAFTVTVCDANVKALSKCLTRDASAKVRRLYNGVDRVSFAPTRLPRAENRILSVGRLVEKKGFDVLVEALSILDQRGVEFEADIVGEGDQRANIETLIRQRGLETRVRLLGARDQGAVRELMSTATLFCLPCLVGIDGNRDALPTVLLESLACGLPSISTPVTGIPEILGHGAAGVLVPERDSVATADAIFALLGNASLRVRLSAKGRARVAELFDLRKNADTLRGWFEEASEAARLETCASSA